MALVSSPCSSPPYYTIFDGRETKCFFCSFFTSNRIHHRSVSASNIYTQEAPKIDKSLLTISKSYHEDELWAAACLRVRSFNEFRPDTYGVQDHKQYLAEREFEALKERVTGKREGFKRVSCISASLPLSHVSSISDDLSSSCKFSSHGGERVMVGTLDLNQCMSLPDEITGMKPEGTGADIMRAYPSNVCVAKELHRNGLAYALIEQAKFVAEDWGKHFCIRDLYVHVAVDNEPAKNLYLKSGFVYENEEAAWQARFLDRPRRIILWTGLSGS